MVRLLGGLRSAHRTLESPICKYCLFSLHKLHQSAVFRYPDDRCYFDPFQSGHCSGTMDDVREALQKIIGVETAYHIIPKCRSSLLKFLPNREHLPKRSMRDSFTTTLLPLSESQAREHYVNHLGTVRCGRILEDLDLFAVWICYRHVKLPTLPKGTPHPYVFVTLLVDEIDFFGITDITGNDDIYMSGHVSWTGISSMELTIYLQQRFRNIAKAIFMMVARNATNTGPAAVNPVKPANKEEVHCLKEAIKRQRERRKKHARSVLNVRPTKIEEELMYNMFSRIIGNSYLTGKKPALPSGCCWMAESFQTSMLHSFPDSRNTHNTIFGGYIMRNALELSYITANIYAKGRPLLECVVDVAFYRPVKVHSFIKISAYVVYTVKQYMQLMTVVQVMDGNSLEKMTTNAFHFTYRSLNKVDEVLPATYQETLWYISGRDKFHAFQKKRGIQIEDPIELKAKTK